ncbi:MAG: hypothetical protein HY730_09545 [Candidatus Tectomicrobia bacterium]|uniref:Uncharacterized protein n=1 Tax=Tectimicrobiota bacterium TaxID=2528274 RepID=A0A933GPR9_UNCTE|nr:hypothetical protein [Candidatus Tectomicrobia bacterium]
MPVTLPIDVYEVFEKSFGKENAHMVVKSLEATISDVTDYRWKVTKDELLDSIRKEFVTREIFEERFKTLDNKMDERFKSLNFKLNIFLAIAFIALTFANPTFVKLLERLLKF